jgi:hypothetical protein
MLSPFAVETEGSVPVEHPAGASSSSRKKHNNHLRVFSIMIRAISLVLVFRSTRLTYGLVIRALIPAHILASRPIKNH